MSGIPAGPGRVVAPSLFIMPDERRRDHDIDSLGCVLAWVKVVDNKLVYEWAKDDIAGYPIFFSNEQFDNSPAAAGDHIDKLDAKRDGWDGPTLDGLGRQPGMKVHPTHRKTQ